MPLSKEEKFEIENLIRAEIKRTLDAAIHQFESLSKQSFFKNKTPEQTLHSLLKMVKEGVNDLYT